jgi:hypothetical protein
MTHALILTAALVSSAALTPAETTRVGNEIIADYERGTDGLGPRFDSELYLDRSLKGVTASATFMTGFREGARKTLKPGEGLLVAMQRGSTLSFRKAVTLDGEQAAQLRVLHKDGSFNILEIILVKNAVGTVKAVDMWNLIDGERDSDRVHRLAAMAAADENQGLLDRLVGKEKSFAKNLPTFRALVDAAQNEKWPEVVANYKKLPPELQDDRLVATRYLMAINNVDPAEYRKAMAHYIASHASDASVSMMAIDYYFTDKRWDDAIKAIDVVEQRIGTDDGWLEMLRGNIRLEAGDKPGAKAHYAKSVAREPLLRNSYEVLIGLAMQEKNWPDTSKWLTAMEQDGKLTLNDLRTVPEYAGFVASKEGKAFVKAHAKGR